MLVYPIFIVLALVVVLLATAIALSPGRPKQVLDEHGQVVPGSIAEKVFIDVNGVPQGMFIVSRNARNPVMLVLHGGLPEYFLAERYPTGLEDLFTMVWWEQRGAGISYRDDLPKESMTPEQLISDTVVVTNYLRERFSQQRIYLLAHSGGTFFGIQAAARHPELYLAYVGVAQYAHQIVSEQLAYDYMLKELDKRGDAKMLDALKSCAVGPSQGTPTKYLLLRDPIMHRLGIGTMHSMHSILSGLFLTSLRFRGYTVAEKLKYWRGKARNGVSVLWDKSLYIDMREHVPELKIPVYFLEGIYDYTCNSSLAEAYFRVLKAPVKGFYWFKQSAHSPHFEEPARTKHILQHDVLTGTSALSDVP